MEGSVYYWLGKSLFTVEQESLMLMDHPNHENASIKFNIFEGLLKENENKVYFWMNYKIYGNIK